MSKGPLIEDCFYITPNYNLDPIPFRERGVHIEYHMEAEDHILVTVRGNEPQRIETEDVVTGVSWRRYFLCPECSKRAHKLYLLPNGNKFKCRSCHHGLRYTLTTINKKTPHGKVHYALTRMDKLSKKREKMGTIMYNGKYTKKFEAFLRQCDRAGYTKASEDARSLLKAINDFQKV